MQVFLNGRWLPEERAVVSVFDRGFLYGDGLFEVVRVCNGRPFRWEQHWERFERGVRLLKLTPPYSVTETLALAHQLIRKNKMPEALLRVTLSRGLGLRGYSPRGADRPTFVLSLHPLPPQYTRLPQWKLVTATQRLPDQGALAGFKTANKLPQILARAEADAAGADEALLLNAAGRVVEGTTSNLFWLRGQTMFTPPLATGILPGITRTVMLEICQKQKLPVREKSPRRTDLLAADAVFLSMSSWGVAEAVMLDGRKLSRSPLVRTLRRNYDALLTAETK